MTYYERFGQDGSTSEGAVPGHEHDTGDITGAWTLIRLGPGGSVQTAASGPRVVLSAGVPARISFYSGAASETAPAYLQSIGYPAVALVGPLTTGATAPSLAIDPTIVYARGVDQVLLLIEGTDRWISLREYYADISTPLSMDFNSIWGVAPPGVSSGAATREWVERAGEYTVTMTGSVTDPTLGAGAYQVGFWKRVGVLCFVSLTVQWGGAGLAAGNGDYRFSLPFPAVWRSAPIGHGFILDDSTGDSYYTDVRTLDTDNTVVYLHGRSDATTLFFYGAAAPVVPATDDEVSVQFVYEVPADLVEFRDYYPAWSSEQSMYLEGTNVIVPASPTRAVLWFEHGADGLFYLYNSAPEGAAPQCHYDTLQWTGGYLQYSQTYHYCGDVEQVTDYTPAIVFLPEYWIPGDSWSYSDSSAVTYTEDSVPVKTGTNAYTSEIIGQETLDGETVIHFRTSQVTTWDDLSVTNWQEDYYFGAVGGFGRPRGMVRSVGGNLDTSPVDNWDITFNTWDPLP